MCCASLSYKSRTFCRFCHNGFEYSRCFYACVNVFNDDEDTVVRQAGTSGIYVEMGFKEFFLPWKKIDKILKISGLNGP